MNKVEAGLWVAIVAIMATYAAVAYYLVFEVPTPTPEPEMKVFESLVRLSAIKGTEYPPLEDACNTTYRLLGDYVSASLEITDPYNRYTAAGDRALALYWVRYPLICSCVAANHYPPRELVDNIEKLATRLEVIDHIER